MIGTIKVDGLNADSISFLSALVRGTDEGKAVSISTDNTVAIAADGGVIFGKVHVIDKADAVATVQSEGYAELAYTGDAPTVGAYQALVGNGTGGVKIVASPAVGDKHFDIISVDTDNGLVVFKLG